ncbi:MAG: Ig-like domain-containing protein, partial [Nitrospiraceae bacterium]|nr:Ig-like domain-containing protein [Nitrospiraceae bacterium]
PYQCRSNNVWVTSSDGYNYTPVVEKTPVTIYPGWGDGEGGYWEPGTSNIVNWWDGAIIELNTASCGAGSPYITYFDTYSGSGSSLSSPGPIAVDKSGNLWVVALGGGFPNYGQWFSVNTAEFSSSTGNLIPLPSGVPDPGLQNFNSLAADPAGNIWAYAGLSAPANYTGTPNLSEIEPGGPVSNYTVQSSGSLNNDALVPYNGSPVAVDPSGNIWIVSTPYAYSPTISSSTVYEYAPNGSLKNKYILGVTVPGFFVSQAPGQIAFDPSGNAWVIGKNSSGAEGVIVINPQSAGGQQAFFQVPDPIAITSGSYSLTPPTVSSVSPANNATGVSTSSSVTATFSEAMNPSTINSSTFTLTGPNGTQVAGTVIYNATANTATFTPSFPLSTGTSYTATVTTGAYGANNLAFKSAYSWSFTTTAPASGGTNTFTIGTRPVGIAIDASGNIWVANSGDGTVEELNSSGSVIGTFTSNISGPGYIAIDASGNVWVTGNNTFITELLKSSGYTTSSTFNMAAPDMAGPARIAIDASGNVWTANTYSGSTSLYEFLAPNYTTSNTFSAGIPGGGIMTGLAIDGYGNVWSGSNNYGYGEVTELLSSSSYGSSNGFSNSSITGPEDIAIDASGNAWVPNNPDTGMASTVVKLTAPSTYSSPYTAGIAPEGVAIDHSGNIWVANNGSNTVEELDQSGNIVKTYSVGTNPTDIAIDASGDVWVTNYGDGTVSELVGVATGPQFFPYSGPQFP